MGGDGAGVFAQLAGHEQVSYWSDPTCGLRAVVAIHSTALGPALGGTRFYPYPSEAAAVADVLDLARAMTYKAACAGLDLGGGKAVVIGDPTRDKSEALLRSYGRFVQSLGGRYVTACDVGTYVEDMDVVARECDFVTGRSPWNGGAGDSSVLTALGVHEGMRAVAEQLWGEPSLSGRTVGISGVGKVGRLLAGHLVEDGAKVLVTDVSQAALDRVVDEHPEVVVLTPAELPGTGMDVYAPCALGHALTAANVADLAALAVCGGANNQLATPEVADLLTARGILYAPDYVVNAGGIIQVAEEVDGYDANRAEVRTRGIFDTTRRVLTEAAAAGVSPVVAADRIAEDRIARVGGLRRFLLPGRP